MKLKEVYPPRGEIRKIYCDKCGKHTSLSYTTFDDLVEDIHITIEDLPVLLCETCNCYYLPDASRFAIIYIFEQAEKKGKKQAKVRWPKRNEAFDFTEVPFLYDADDYYFIPGLKRANDGGYLTPVFFNNTVLIKFDNLPDYRISFASKTYGEIRRGDDYSIPFGINENKRVIMWLGDIAKLPLNEQYYLRSENVESDHKIGSEFYDGQIEVIFTDLPPEDELIRARSDFYESAYKKFGIRLTHLDNEILKLLDELTPPPVYTDKEKHHVADTLNKINIESINAQALGELLKKRGENPDNLGGLKRLQKLYEIEYPGESISTVISLLFVLYDLRVAYSHLTSEPKKEKSIQSICDRLSIQRKKEEDFDEVYSTLVRKLIDCYRYLSQLQ